MYNCHPTVILTLCLSSLSSVSFCTTTSQKHSLSCTSPHSKFNSYIHNLIYRIQVRRVRSSGEKLRCGLGIEGVEEVVRRGRLRWFGHVERKEADDWVSKCRNLVVVGGVKKGRPRKTWMECVKEDMDECGLKKEDAQDRSLWRRLIVGNVKPAL